MMLDNLTSPEWDVDKEDVDLKRRLARGDDEAYVLLNLGEEKAREEGFLPREKTLSIQPINASQPKVRRSRVNPRTYRRFLLEAEPYLSQDATSVEPNLRAILRIHFPRRYENQHLADASPQELWGVANHIASYARSRIEK